MINDYKSGKNEESGRTGEKKLEHFLGSRGSGCGQTRNFSSIELTTVSHFYNLKNTRVEINGRELSTSAGTHQTHYIAELAQKEKRK